MFGRWQETDVEPPAEDHNRRKRRWRKLAQPFLPAEVRTFQKHPTSCRPSRKFKGETSEEQHQQTFHRSSAHSHRGGRVCFIGQDQ